MKNWKTTLSGIGAAFMSLLGALAALPYQLLSPDSPLITFIAPEWKLRISVTSFLAAFVLRTINSIFQKDNTPKQ